MSDPVHPSFTFLVNLDLLATEQMGPNTNSKDIGVLHPTAHQNDTDNGRTEKSNFKNTRSTWKPGFLAGENRVLKHGDTFTITGEKALYIRDMYAVGYAPSDRACLELQ